MTSDLARLTARAASEARAIRAKIQYVRAMFDECLARDAPPVMYVDLRRQRLRLVSRLEQLEALEATIAELKRETT